MNIPPPLRRVLAPLAKQADSIRLPLYLVGGCVRDLILGVATRDIDLVTEGDPGALAKYCVRRWGGRLETFGRFGTIRVSLESAGLRFDFARSRAEAYPKPAALPVVLPARLSQDLGRRDFSINAMALPLTPGFGGDVIDLHGGTKDLGARRLRVLHDLSFRDDPTRLFRAARYGGRLSFKLETHTARLLRQSVRVDHAALLSRERIRQELMRLLDEKDPDPALELLARWGLLKQFHPDFRWSPEALEGDGAVERLGLIALGMPPGSGEEFLSSLPLDHAVGSEIGLALKQDRSKRSPRGELPQLTRHILRLHLRGLPERALAPLYLSGEDLKALGLEPGKEFSRWLDIAAQAQWRGEFKDRSQALRWLGYAVKGKA